MIVKSNIIRKLIGKLRRLIGRPAGKPQTERKDNVRPEHGVFVI